MFLGVQSDTLISHKCLHRIYKSYAFNRGRTLYFSKLLIHKHTLSRVKSSFIDKMCLYWATVRLFDAALTTRASQSNHSNVSRDTSNARGWPVYVGAQLCLRDWNMKRFSIGPVQQISVILCCQFGSVGSGSNMKFFNE